MAIPIALLLAFFVRSVYFLDNTITLGYYPVALSLLMFLVVVIII
jgi:hypothetical protein